MPEWGRWIRRGSIALGMICLLAAASAYVRAQPPPSSKRPTATFTYVAVVTGAGGPQTMTFPVLVPEIQNPPDHGAEVWVFELPQRQTR